MRELLDELCAIVPVVPRDPRLPMLDFLAKGNKDFDPTVLTAATAILKDFPDRIIGSCNQFREFYLYNQPAANRQTTVLMLAHVIRCHDCEQWVKGIRSH